MPRCLSLSDYPCLLIFLFSLYLTLSLPVALSVWLCLSLSFVSFYPYISLSPCFCLSLPNIPIFCLNPTVSCLSLSFVALCLPLSLSISVSVYFCVSPSVFVCLCLSVSQSLPSVIFPFSLLPIFSWQTHLHFQFLLLRHSWTPNIWPPCRSDWANIGGNQFYDQTNEISSKPPGATTRRKHSPIVSRLTDRLTDSQRGKRPHRRTDRRTYAVIKGRQDESLYRRRWM